MRKFIFCFMILRCVAVFSQKGEQSYFMKELMMRKDTFLKNDQLYTSFLFFKNEEWDSTIVHTSRNWNYTDLDSGLVNFYHMMRAFSLQKKKVFEEAKREYNKIVPSFEFFGVVRNQLGKLALYDGDFKKALDYFQEIKKEDSNTLLGVQIDEVDHNIGLCYLYLKDYNKAEGYLKRSLETKIQNNDSLAMFACYSDIANLYYVQYKDDEAIKYFKNAYILSKQLDDLRYKSIGALNMAVVEENRKDFRKALQYRKELEQWKDSLNDQDRIYQTAQLEKKIAVEQKEKEVEILEAENRAKEAQKRVYLFSGILLAILLIIVFYSYKGTQQRNQIITAQKEDLDALNSTKDKLFSIVSHDLRSSVNAIKTSNKKLLGNLDSQNKEEISQNLQQNSAIVNGAYSLLDNLLNWAMLQTQQTYFEMTRLSLSRIVDHVAFNYLPILEDQQIEYSNLVSKKTQVFADQESVKIILRNLLDNAIKFSKEKGKINIYTRDTSDPYVHLVVEDAGLGIDAETRKELLKDTQLLTKKKHEDILGTGLGLHLVKSMIDKNQGEFDIESEEGKGTKMIISLLRFQES